ncbi:patatin-like phospholipase family protein [Reichenbachiella ulvae]|uniref:Patatin-like phospholipase family protein n=1 Tax=Reichenbachiella ulvae TaxID=2980104 RepID=A0ABT3CRL2_9BACT|nr:patatin-like phospholipase family protein [Reichenbachiella ulvae]MCV9386351.1 patatin-like phospholipase family protein [Reichenbachiella ulvae]
MAKKTIQHSIFERFIFSFPVQLLVQYFKSHQLLLLPWILTLLFVTNSAGRVMGIPYLFLDPEYMHQVNFWSFFIMGVSFGTMVTAFHITGYILHGGKYRFVGMLQKPFSKFSINNSIIPFSILLIYLSSIVVFQHQYEESSKLKISLFVLAFLLGLVAIISILYGYFKFTNKDIYAFITRKLNTKLKLISLSRINILDRLALKKKRKVYSFLDLNLRFKKTSEILHIPDKKVITKVFDQNHLNSVILVAILLTLILLMGLGVDHQAFQIPAAATVFILFSILTMAVGALAYWAKEWVVTAVIVIYLLMDIFFVSGVILDYHEAFGMNYEGSKATYSIPELQRMNTDSIIAHDKRHMLSILEKWKQKQSDSLPQAVFVCVSGGGSRSALWAFSSLSAIDKKLNQSLTDRTVLMTGASGGMVGASYYRELAYQAKQKRIDSPDDLKYYNNISRDNLNPMIFNMVVNDLFLRNPTFNYEGREYSKDRGYAFERQLNINTNYALDKKLIEYGQLESEGKVPLILFGPTIMNDGRKLYISSHHTAYMNTETHAAIGVQEAVVDAIDFMRFFEDQDAKDIKYTSALRMNASFPYITPSISLPSNPTIKVMDAGVTDNFGLTDAIRFIYAFRDWFEENTSGITIISIRDTKRVQAIKPQAYQTIFDKIANPISSVYNNLANFQDVNNEYKMAYLKEWYEGPVNHFVIEYDMYEDFRVQNELRGISNEDSTKAKRPSLNWHLTAREKQSIMRNIDSDNNQQTIRQLIEHLGYEY